MTVAVFSYPILPGKTERERTRQQERNAKLESDANLKDALSAYRSGMGWTDVGIWIQQLADEDLHLVLLRSDGEIEGTDLHRRFCDRIESGCPVAKDVRDFYLETEGVDFCEASSYPQLNALKGTDCGFTADELKSKTVTEYAFAYPLKEEYVDRVAAHYEAIANDPEKLKFFVEQRRRLGIVEMNSWIQSGLGRHFIVTQQKVLDPLSDSQTEWHRAVAEDATVKAHAAFMGEATGLTPSQMLPSLEALS